MQEIYTVGQHGAVRTQAQYVFIHDAIKHKLESLGYGVTSRAADDDDAADDEDLYQSKSARTGTGT